MAIVFRTKYLQVLKKLLADNKLAFPDHFDLTQIINLLFKKEWILYAKKPFGGPQQVIEYLRRYTHKVAISNNRIKQINT